MKNNKNNYILGTANLWSKYGFKSKFIGSSQSISILKFSQKKNIKILDISSSYPSFINIIKKFNLNKFKISFKVSNNDFKKKIFYENFNAFFYNLLNQLNVSKIEYFLFHNAKDMLSNKNKKIIEHLYKLKSNKKIKYLGVSVYSDNDLFKILKKNLKIDVVQIPFNVLDQRINQKKLLNFIKLKKIKIHVRSIFLQGILVDKDIIPGKFNKFKELLNWHNFLKKNKLDSLTEIMNFLSNFKFIDKVVIGVKNKDQLKQILNTKIYKNKRSYQKFKSNNLELIDPRKW